VQARTDVATRMMGWNLTANQSALIMEAEWHAANIKYKKRELEIAEYTFDEESIVKAEDAMSSAELTQFTFEEARRKTDLKTLTDQVGYGKKPSAKMLESIEVGKQGVVEIQDEMNTWHVDFAKRLLKRAKTAVQESLDSQTPGPSKRNPLHRPVQSLDEDPTSPYPTSPYQEESSDDEPACPPNPQKLEKEMKKMEKEVEKAMAVLWEAEDQLFLTPIRRAEEGMEETKASSKGGKPDPLVMAEWAVQICARELEYAQSLLPRAIAAQTRAGEGANEKVIKAAEKALEGCQLTLKKKEEEMGLAVEERDKEEVEKEKRKVAAAKRKEKMVKAAAAAKLQAIKDELAEAKAKEAKAAKLAAKKGKKKK